MHVSKIVHFFLKYSILSIINITGNNNSKNNNFVADIVNAPKVSKLKEFPKIRKNIDPKILKKATQNASTDPEKMNQSFLDVVRILSINSLLSTRLKPILSAAENLALQISHFGIYISSLLYIFRAIQSKMQS